jgi:rod shape-determining protein MreD
MNVELMKGLVAFVVVLLAQALVLNHIHLFGCATPMVYVYLVLLFRRGYARWAIIALSFIMGLCVDIFSNTPGVAAGSMTFMGLLQPYLLELFVPRDSAEDLWPSMRTLGIGKFTAYASICVLVFFVLFYTLETFNFFNWLQWLESIGGSFCITMLLLLVIENFRVSV